MKKINALIIMLFIVCIAWSQTEDLSITQVYRTSSTSGLYKGCWTKIAECEIVSAYADHGSVIRFFGNGGSNRYFHYGDIIARFKNQNATIQKPNYCNLELTNSNISPDNITAVINDTKVEVYIRLPYSYTSVTFKSIINTGNHLSLLSEQGFIENLPPGDILGCVGSIIYSSDIRADRQIVDGLLEAKEIKVTNAPGADFVFEDNYHLKDLSEVEAFIKANRHLPEIPSAAEMEEAGVNLAEMNKLLLMKVEELTLYAIEQKAVAEKNEAEVDRLKAEMEEVRSSESEVRKEMKKEVEGLELKVEKLSDEKRAMRGEMEKMKEDRSRVTELEERLVRMESLLEELSNR